MGLSEWYGKFYTTSPLPVVLVCSAVTPQGLVRLNVGFLFLLLPPILLNHSEVQHRKTRKQRAPRSEIALAFTRIREKSATKPNSIAASLRSRCLGADKYRSRRRRRHRTRLYAYLSR